jgi:hypothetical protein
MTFVDHEFQKLGVWLFDDDADLLAGDGDAALLLLTLRRKYIDQDEPFALSPNLMQRDNFIPSWGRHKYAVAIETLSKAGLIRCAKLGGRGRSNVPMYELNFD